MVLSRQTQELPRSYCFLEDNTKAGSITWALLPKEDVLLPRPREEGHVIEESQHGRKPLTAIRHRRLWVGHHCLQKLERSLLFLINQCLKLMCKHRYLLLLQY